MDLHYVPLLRVMRELHSIPRGQPPDFNGMKRFRQYLRTIFPPDQSADELIPLLAMNPMGKDHVTALLDAYLAMDADAIGARTAAEAAARLADVPGDFKVGLVVADDLLGGGTNRYDCEFSFRFGPERFRDRRRPPKLPRRLKNVWLAGVLWSSEVPSVPAVREAILTAAHPIKTGAESQIAIRGRFTSGMMTLKPDLPALSATIEDEDHTCRTGRCDSSQDTVVSPVMALW
jgi:hypothetical protein